MKIKRNYWIGKVPKGGKPEGFTGQYVRQWDTIEEAKEDVRRRTLKDNKIVKGSLHYTYVVFPKTVKPSTLKVFRCGPPPRKYEEKKPKGFTDKVKTQTIVGFNIHMVSGKKTLYRPSTSPSYVGFLNRQDALLEASTIASEVWDGIGELSITFSRKEVKL